jgi:hypothetical protein
VPGPARSKADLTELDPERFGRLISDAEALLLHRLGADVPQSERAEP